MSVDGQEAAAERGLAWKRIGAELIDWTICFGAGYGITRLIAIAVGEHRVVEDSLTFFLVNELGVTAPSILYYTFLDSTGGTIGKRLLGIRVEAASAPSVSFVRMLGRSWIGLIGMEAAHIGHAFTFTPSPTVAAFAYGSAGAILIAKLAIPFLSRGSTGYEDALFGTKIVAVR